MPRTRQVQNNFTSGIFDPRLHERYEYEKYGNALAELENFLILPHGGVTRRLGTRFVARAKDATANRLLPFIFSAEQGVVIEVGDQYFRFFANSGQVTVAGTPIEVTTTYVEAETFDLYTAQSGDVMFIDAANYAPSELRRIDATDFDLRVSRFVPAPSYEAGHVDASTTLTLSATTGTITITASAPLFFETAVGRTLSEDVTIGQGLAAITAWTSTTVVTAEVIDAFSTTAYLGGEYTLNASPMATLRVLEPGPVGTVVTCVLLGESVVNTNLVANGTFTSNISSWTNYSASLVCSGTSDAAGGAGDEALFDAAATFLTSAVGTGHRVVNVTDTTEDIVVSVSGETLLVTTTDGSDWGGVKSYEVYRTGSAASTSSKARLHGGARGFGWIEQGVTTVAGSFYRVTFDVSTAPLSAFVGSAAQLQDLAAEATYQIGNEREIIFQATGTTSYLNFRNNQNTEAYLDNVVCKLYEVSGWYGTEDGLYLRVNSGIIEVTSYSSASRVVGIVRKELSDELDALPGAWSLETSQWAATYPRCLAFQGERLIHAGSNDYPQKVWGSVPGQPLNFASGANAADALDFQIAATEVNQVLWLHGERALLLGTAREEFTVRGELGHTLTPTGIDASSPSKIGSKAIKPLKVPQALLFVSRGGRRLYESTGVDDFAGDNREVKDRSILAQGLTDGGIRSLAFQQEPDPVVWVVTDDDELLSLTYLKDQDVYGWATHDIGGAVLDVCVIPHPDGDRDQVWFLVDRGASVPYIEYMDDTNGYYGRLMVDSGLTATYSPATDVVTGLSHLDGQTVTVLVDGSQQTDKLVVGGQITLDSPGIEVEVGLGFTSTLVPLRPVVDRQPLSGLQLSNARITVSLLNTLGLTVNGEALDFTNVDDVLGEPPSRFTGLKALPLQGWDDDATLELSQPQPYPCTIRAIIRTLEIEQP